MVKVESWIINILQQIRT